MLLLLLWLRLTGELWPSTIVAALFAWHPLHVESVAWIAERKDVLSTFFELLALLAYARYAQKQIAGRSLPVGGVAADKTVSIHPPFSIFHLRFYIGWPCFYLCWR